MRRTTIAAFALALVAPAHAQKSGLPHRPPDPVEILRRNLEDSSRDLQEQGAQLQERLAAIRIRTQATRSGQMATLRAEIEALAARGRKEEADMTLKEAQARVAREAWLRTLVKLEVTRARLEDMEAWNPPPAP